MKRPLAATLALVLAIGAACTPEPGDDAGTSPQPADEQVAPTAAPGGGDLPDY